MKNVLFDCAVISAFLLLTSCGAGGTRGVNGDVLRAGVDTPANFRPPSGVTVDDDSCHSPMVDPRDGTSLRMVTASGGVGDYEVPNFKYGVNEGELLRLNCRTGEVIGVVKQ